MDQHFVDGFEKRAALEKVATNPKIVAMNMLGRAKKKLPKLPSILKGVVKEPARMAHQDQRQELELLRHWHGLQSRKIPKIPIEKVATKLTARARKSITPSNFVFPKERRYPIHDAAHARNALARVAQNGSPSEQAEVRRAVHEKYPGIGD